VTQAVHATDTAVDFGSGGPAVLKKMWVVPPAETTTDELDDAITHRRKSEASNLAASSTSFRFQKSDILERYLERYIVHNQVITSEILEAIEGGRIWLYAGSANVSTSVFDEFLRNLDASTAKIEVDRLFSHATFIDLEPGMTNEFQEGLEEAIENYGELALKAVESLVVNEKTQSSIAMEAMQYIGYTDSEKWHDERRKTLERCLDKSRSAWVRDGAGLGLASLDDPKSIPALEKAILNETSGALKEDLKMVLNQLQDTLLES
jgi:hypothetical protein